MQDDWPLLDHDSLVVLQVSKVNIFIHQKFLQHLSILVGGSLVSAQSWFSVREDNIGGTEACALLEVEECDLYAVGSSVEWFCCPSSLQFCF